jgi:phosphoglycolate phosphatase-like HAD superfamily hydrolase
MISAEMTRLVLFDVDGTLVLTGRAGARAMNAAFQRLYGHPEALARVPIAGRTDRAIVREALRVVGRDATDDEIARLRAAYLEDLRTELPRSTEAPVGVLPGVGALLHGLEAHPVIDVGLLTGNFERGAAIKLGHFGLWDRFPFGAFGDHHDDRRALVPVALDRAALAGRPVTPAERVVVIGDTPLDVDCAHAHGARAVAVATGPFDRSTLERAGADLVVDSLADAPALVEWIVGAS